MPSYQPLPNAWTFLASQFTGHPLELIFHRLSGTLSFTTSTEVLQFFFGGYGETRDSSQWLILDELISLLQLNERWIVLLQIKARVKFLPV